MTATTVRPSAPTPRPAVGTARRALTPVLRPVVLLPVGLGTLGRALVGRVDRPGRVAACGVASIVAGLLGLVELGLFGVFVFRGLGYGLVVDGPYDDVWGGPTLAGAWAVHAAVGLGVAVVAAGLGLLVNGLHRRVTEGLLGGRRVPAWVVAVSAALTVAVAVLLVAFVRQA